MSNNNTALAGRDLQPPQTGVPITDPAWTDWLYKMYSLVGEDGGTFKKITFVSELGNTVGTTGDFAYNLGLTLDRGIYVNYNDTNQNILYGFACNVTRSAGQTGNYVVGAQINAWSAKGVTGGATFGLAVQGANLPGGLNSIIAFETSAINMSDASVKPKIGLDVVWKDRFDGETTVRLGLGSNQYNYYAVGQRFTSQARSSTGELCGWHTGIDFISGSLDQAIAPTWNNTTFYAAGQIVYYAVGGTCYKCIQDHSNQVPAPASAYWVLHGAGPQHPPVGIDFSSMSTADIGRLYRACIIRLRDSMAIGWTTDAGVVSYLNPISARLRLMDFPAGGTFFEVDTATGFGYNQIGRVF